MTEFDGMVCAACGQEERASEGYPCADCGTFLCIICQFRGVERCSDCEAKAQAAATTSDDADEAKSPAEDAPSGAPTGDAATPRADDPTDG